MSFSLKQERDKYVNFSNRLKELLENRDKKLAHATADIKYYEGKMAFVEKLLAEAEVEQRRIRNKYGDDAIDGDRGADVFASLASALKDMKKGAPKDAIKVAVINYDEALNGDEGALAALAVADEEKEDSGALEQQPVLLAIHSLLDELKQSLDPSERFTMTLLLQGILEMLRDTEGKVQGYYHNFVIDTYMYNKNE